MRFSLILIAAFALLVSCDTDPVFPETPEIAFVSVTPTEATQFSEELEITIHFQDGDGDLGYEEDSDPVNNLFIKDTRSVVPDSISTVGFSIPSLTPETRKPSIQGEITVSLLTPASSQFFDPNSTENQVIFEIYLVDRSGKVSNTILTDPVTILQ